MSDTRASGYKSPRRVGRLQMFGAYQLLERIGVGAMGEVYRAVSRRGGRVVTIKRLMASASGNPEAVASLRREADLLRALDHPGIAKVVDVGEAEGVHFIAYEFIAGRDLRAIHDRARRVGLPPPSSGGRRASGAGDDAPGLVPLDVAVHVVLRVAEALAHAHARTDAAGHPLGLVHRDVSPPNMLVAFDGSVKLLDFGIARTAAGLVRTDAGQVKGTIGYMSPEQVRGEEIDARSDLYSLGVCLWELCTGKRLFDASPPHQIARRITLGDIPPPRIAGARISGELEAVILKALAHSRDKRYPAASELHAELSHRAGAERLLTDPIRVARYVRSLFPEVAAEEAASREEFLDMADNKGGSDLDVFEGLAKKNPRTAVSPALTPPPPSQGRKSTLLGGLGPLPPPLAPPSTGSAPPPPPAPPPPAPPPPASAVPPLPPPASAKPASLPPPVAPPKAGTLPGMPAPLPPPSKLSDVGPVESPSRIGAAPLPPPTMPPVESPSRIGAAPLPPPAPPPKSATPPPPAVLPPPAPPPEKAAGKAAVDMDWDDEEESTHVYDKAEHGARPTKPVKVGAAAALLASSGGAARTVSTPPPAITPSVPPPPPVPASDAPRRDEPTAIRPRPVLAQPATGSGGRLGVILGGVSLVVVLGLAVFTLLPKKGQFKVNVSAKSGASVGAVDIYVDGQKKCETTPCVISELEPGSKTIKVIAPGFPPAETIDSVEAGKEKVVFVSLEGAAAPATPTGAPAANSTVSSLKIAGTEWMKAVKVLVDGVDKGGLPLDVREIPPGTHKIRFEGGERYEPLEQVVEIGPGQAKDLGEVKLKVLKGQVTIDLATAGANVMLVNKKGDKKDLAKLLKSPPVKLDVNPSEGWKLVANKKGFEEFSQELTFDDGRAEKTIAISLTEVGKAPPATPTPTPATPTPATPTPPAATQAPAPTPPAATPPASGNGTLNINSIPVSKVMLDGKPLGSTPKVGVSVSAGSHTVTFVHPEQGRKSVTVTVKAGETKTAAVKF